MFLSIEQDANRFRQIVRGQVKQQLRKYISNGELIGRQGKDLVSIPIPQIDLPHFRFGKPQNGVGQGEGEDGSPVGPGQPGTGVDRAGEEPGQHLLEVEISMEELAAILGEELALPRILPKNRSNITDDTLRYTGIRRVGPEGLRSFKRTYRETLKRQLASGSYDPLRPSAAPIREDKRYRSWKTSPRPENNAVIVYMMDVSGSMSDKKKNLVRLTAFWIDTWLRAHYRSLNIRYLVHDAAAKEVDQHTFYHLRESGGTRISSAFHLCAELIRHEYPPEDWNVYAFHFSDGENFNDEDDQRCLELLNDSLLPAVNLFCYGQVRGSSGPLFLDTLSDISSDRLACTKIDREDDIIPAIQKFLGKGY